MAAVSVMPTSQQADPAQVNHGGLKVTGIVGLVRALNNPDVSRSAGFVRSIARALGKELENA